MPTRPFQQAVTVKLNGSGAGTIKQGPLTAREQWHDITVSVSANKNPTNEAQCTISVGDAYTKSFRDLTVNGSSGDSSTNVTDTVKCGSYVWADWTGGDANVMATLNITGMKDI